MKQSFITILILALTTSVLWGQQTIKGLITDADSDLPLIGANVTILNTDPVLGASTDVDGYFSISNVPIGRQEVIVQYLGYEEVVVPNVVVNSGKETVLNLRMKESIEELSTVVVSSKKSKAKTQNEMATVSARSFNVEEVNRFSGGRSDIARLASNFAGVSNADDSRNDIVIRGNSPTGVLWRLEGIPIPNPNHFSTLGTTGGPVSAMNPNLIKDSDFLTSAFPSEYGNALGGVFDLGLRRGNRDKPEFMIQLGAISGFEGMAEGPLGNKNKGSYVVSARYSFVGLMSNLGLNVGTNATPNYSDLSFNVDFGKGKAGNFSVFGVGGVSDIDFLHDEIDEDDLFAASDEDLFAKSRFGVIGVKHNLILDDRTYLRTIVAASNSSGEVDQFRFYNMDTPEEIREMSFFNDNSETRLSLSSYINRKYSARFTLRAGILLEQYLYDIKAESNDFGPDVNNDGIRELIPVYEFNDDALLSQVFAQGQIRLSQKLTLNPGLHFQHLSINDNAVIEPRLALNWKVAPKHTISLGYGLHHQPTPLPILLAESVGTEGETLYTNEDLEFTRSNHFVIGHDFNIAQNWRSKIEVYYQDLDNVPVDPFASSFSMLNVGNDFGFPQGKVNLVNDGTGFNRGFELTLEKFYSNGFYGLMTASIFESKYEGSDGIERNTAFNNGRVINILAGKEFKIGKSGKNAFRIDTKLTTAGGRYYTPVDLEASRMGEVEIRQEDMAFSERYDDYFRWDLKFGFTINQPEKKRAHTFYFDIQNVTNNENIFERRYNRQTGEVNEAFQIGFFPDFMYRLEF